MKVEWTNKDVLTQSETTGLNSKAVLVIDMPESCVECPLRTFEPTENYGACLATYDIKEETYEDVHEEKEWREGKRWSGCPLRPLPQKKEMFDGKLTFDKMAEYIGYNACLDAITGEEA